MHIHHLLRSREYQKLTTNQLDIIFEINYIIDGKKEVWNTYTETHVSLFHR